MVVVAERVEDRSLRILLQWIATVAAEIVVAVAADCMRNPDFLRCRSQSFFVELQMTVEVVGTQ